MEDATSCYVDGLAVAGRACKYWDDNPDGGTISFDNVPAAMLPVLQAITFDTWTDPVSARAPAARPVTAAAASARPPWHVHPTALSLLALTASPGCAPRRVRVRAIRCLT